MEKVRLTSGAGLKLRLPPCAAVMEHEPTCVRWTVDPLAVQSPLAVKLTGNPEVAVALTAKSGFPMVLFASAAKLMVWSSLPTPNDCETSAAGSKLPSPDCEAVMVQLPAPLICTVVPLTAQSPLALKLTARPEDAEALTLKSGSPNVLFPSGANVTDCAARLTVNEAVELLA